MIYYTIENSQPKQVTGRRFIDSAGVSHSTRGFRAWSDTDLNAVGVFGLRPQDKPVHDPAAEKVIPVVNSGVIEWGIVTLSAPEVAERASAAKEHAFTKLRGDIEEQVSSSIATGAPHNGTRWLADAESQLAKASMAASIGAGRGLAKGRTTVTVRDLNRTKHDMTQSEYLDLGEAIRDYVSDVLEVADNHIDALLSLMADEMKTAADLEAYDVTTGWPV